MPDQLDQFTFHGVNYTLLGRYKLTVMIFWRSVRTLSTMSASFFAMGIESNNDAEESVS